MSPFARHPISTVPTTASPAFAKGGYWGPIASCQDARVASGNVGDDTGRTLRP